MWHRAKLKHFAKKELKSSYWKAVLVSLLGGILGAEGVGAGGLYGHVFSLFRWWTRIWTPTILIFNFVALLPLVVGILVYRIFVSNVIGVGLNSSYSDSPGKSPAGEVICLFR